MLSDEALNILIAEKIMGWQLLAGAEAIAAFDGRPGPVDVKRWHHERIWVFEERQMACQECGSMPRFNSKIKDAWQVIEKMLERGFSPTVNHNGPPGHFTHSPDWAGPWHCCFHNTKGCLHCGDESCKCYSHAEADTPARAICLAALKARGVEVSDAD